MTDAPREIYVAETTLDGKYGMWNAQPTDGHIRYVRDDGWKPASVTIEVVNDHALPSFGAYYAGSASDGLAVIKLQMSYCLAGAKATEKPFSEFLSDVLTHEIGHVLQELFGQRFSETEIDAAMQLVDADEALDSAENDAQVIEGLLRQIHDLHEREKWHPASEPPEGKRRQVIATTGAISCVFYSDDMPGHYTHWRELQPLHELQKEDK